MIGSRLCRTLVVSGVAVGVMSSTAFRSPTAFGAGATTLSSELLSAAALGGGWKTESSSGYTAGIPACVAAAYKTVTDQSALARRTFESSTGTESFQDRLVTFTGGAAVARTTAIEKSIASCPAESGGVRMTVSKLAFTAVGEQSEAFRILFVLKSGRKVSGVFGIARQGSTVIVATHAQMGAGTGTGTTQGKSFATLAIRKAA